MYHCCPLFREFISKGCKSKIDHVGGPLRERLRYCLFLILGTTCRLVGRFVHFSYTL